jgi:uncharacterized protein (DUF2336 family)
MSRSQALTAEFEQALSAASDVQQRDMLRRVTDLFCNGVDGYSEEHIEVFDDVMCRLLEKADNPSLIELSHRIASVDRAPRGLVRRLSCHDNIAIAGPILQASSMVDDKALVEIAITKSPAHIAAIAARPCIGEAVTDILIDQGNTEIVRSAIANAQARISEMGFVKLVNSVGCDKELATVISSRPDLPAELRPFLQAALA